MAKKKAELEHDAAQYASLMEQSRIAEKEGRYRSAVTIALSAWDFIDGMMEFERRFNKRDFASIGAIDVVLKYAPLILDFHSLKRLETLLKESRRIERDTSDDIGSKLDAAREQMWKVHKLWDFLDRNPDAHQDDLRRKLGGVQDDWKSLVTTLDNLGLVQRKADGNSYRLDLRTRLGRIVRAKCPSCGATTEAPKAMLLEPTRCPECGNPVWMVLLADSHELQSSDE